MNNVYEFPNKQLFYEYLDNLKKAYDKNLLKNFVCIYEREYNMDDPQEVKDSKQFAGKNMIYWFGKSCTTCLGLCDLMKQYIVDYIRDENK